MKDLRQNINIVFRTMGIPEAQKGIKGVQDQTKKLGKEADSVAGKLQKWGSALRTSAVLFGLSRVGKKLFEIGTDVEETASKFRTTFGSATRDMQAFLDEFNMLAGTSNRAAQDVAATFGAITRGVGATAEEAATLSAELVKLAGDLQSFYNIRFEDAVRKIRGGLTGEYEGLKSLGIAMNSQEANLRALAATGKNTAEELTKLEQLQGRMALLFERSAVAVGDLERTADSTQNTWRRLKGIFTRFTEDVATETLPVFADLIDTLDVLTGSAAGSGGFMQKLTYFIKGLVRVVREGLLGIRALGSIMKWVSGAVGRGFISMWGTLTDALKVTKASFLSLVEAFYNLSAKFSDNWLGRKLGLDADKFREQAEGVRAEIDRLRADAEESGIEREKRLNAERAAANAELDESIRRTMALKDLYAGIETPKVKGFVEEIMMINEQLDKGKINAEQALEWWGNLSKGLDDITAQYPRVAEAAGELQQRLQELAKEELDIDTRSQATKNRMARAKAYAEQVERAVKLQKELADADKRTAEILKERGDLMEKVVDLQSKLPDLEGETLQKAEAQIAAWGDRIKVLDTEAMAWKRIAADIDFLTEGVRDFTSELVEGMNKEDSLATLDAIIESVETLIALQEKSIPLKVLEGEDEDELRRQLEETRAHAVQWLRDVAGEMMDVAPELGEMIGAMVGEALSGLNPKENPEVQRLISDFQKIATEASAAFQQDKDIKKYQRAIKGAYEATKAALEALRGIIPSEQIDLAIAALDRAIEAALGLLSVYDQLAGYADAFGSLAKSIRDSADQLGILGDEARDALTGVANLADGFASVNKSIDALKSAGSFLEKLQAIPGMVSGVAGMISGAATAGRALSNLVLGRKSKDEIEAAREQAKRMEELAKALKDNAYKVSEAVKDLTRQAQLSGDRTGRELQAWINAIEKYQQDIDTILTILQITLDSIPDTGLFSQSRRAAEEAAQRSQVNAFLDFLEDGIRQGFIDNDALAYFNNLVQQGATEFEAMNQTLQDLDIEGLLEIWKSAVETWADNIAGAFDKAAFLIRLGGESAADAYQNAFAEILDTVEGFSPEVQALLSDIASASSPEQIEEALAEFSRLLADENTDLAAVLDGIRWEDLQMILDGALEWAQAMRNASEDTTGTIDWLERGLERLNFAITYGATTAEKAFRKFFREFERSPDTKYIADTWLKYLLDATDPAEIRSQVSAWARQILEMTDDEIMAATGLTRDQVEQLFSTAMDFADALEEGTADVTDATEELSDAFRQVISDLDLFTRYLSEDATEALGFFLDNLLSGGQQFDDALKALLEEARGLDLSTTEGQARLKEIIQTIVQGLLGDSFTGLLEGQGEDIVSALDRILGMAPEAEGDEEFSRSVQIRRTITEIQANEVVALLNEANLWLAKIYGVLDGDPGQQYAEAAEMHWEPRPPIERPELEGLLEEVREAPSGDLLGGDPMGSVNDIDVAITIESGPIEEMMAEIERELRRRVSYTGYRNR